MIQEKVKCKSTINEGLKTNSENVKFKTIIDNSILKYHQIKMNILSDDLLKI